MTNRSTLPPDPGTHANLPDAIAASLAFQAPADSFEYPQRIGGDVERIREALSFVSPDDRETWLKMGMAIKNEIGATGFDIWDAWSQGSDAYNATDARDVWKSIKADGGISGGTLFHEAKLNGWRDESYTPPTPAEIAERQRKAEEQAARDAEDAARQQAETARKAAAVWDQSVEATENPYLTRKGVAATETLRQIETDTAAKILGYHPSAGRKRLNGTLLVAPLHRGGELVSLELIDGSGIKAALKGKGTKTGAYWSAQPLDAIEGTVIVAEGVSTALSIQMATGLPVVAALSVSNFAKVISAIHASHKRLRPILAADLDKETGEPIEAAVKASTRFRPPIPIVAPDFGPERPEGATDFNDLHVHRGLDVVRTQIETAVQAIEPDAGEDEEPPETGLFPPASERPCYCVLDDWEERDGQKYRPGVYQCSKKEKEGGGYTLSEHWFCSPLHVDAITYDGQENNFGRLLRFRNSLKRWREWAMPMELLRGSGEELRGELLAMGVELDPYQAKKELPAYLQREHPKRRIHCALQTGWAGACFVLPDVVIGPTAAGVIFQSGERGHDEYTTAGTLDGWETEIAARAVGNPLLMMGLSAGFAGPMLQKCLAEGGGVHLVGESSTGKSTIVDGACSIWGGRGYKRSWKGTANGQEGVAALFNDNLLALDEISEADPREVGAIVYQLGNGTGKQRANRSGRARAVTRWRCLILSSGERTIATTMQEGGHRAKAGQAVRMLDVPAARAYGAWDDLHGMPSGEAFSDAIKQAAIRHHGLVGRAFLERLTREEGDFPAMLENFKAHDLFKTPGGEGQEKRAAARFALIGMAGELATEYGLTGWAKGDALNAAGVCFRLWHAERGGGNDERRQILDKVARFIERHGDSRFSDANATTETIKVYERAGWWRDTQDGRDYLFNSDGMREALTGFDFRRALDVLQEAGVIDPPRANGERARFDRIGGRPVKVYAVHSGRLAEIEPAGAEHGA